MIQRIFSGTDIQGVAVGQERLAAQLFHIVGHVLGKIGPQESQIAQFTEMNLDGNIFSGKIKLS